MTTRKFVLRTHIGGIGLLALGLFASYSIVSTWTLVKIGPESETPPASAARTSYFSSQPFGLYFGPIKGKLNLMYNSSHADEATPYFLHR
jgi:hypothetical protein